MRYFDLHCDTAFELYKGHKSYIANDLQNDAARNGKFSDYKQVFAFWSDNSYSDDENYHRFFAARDYVLSKKDFPKPVLHSVDLKKADAVIGVEGASLLSDDISRLDKLYDAGMRLLTLAWEDVSCIGGAYNTNVGLTSFGVKTVVSCFDKHIIIDVSHLSEIGTKEVLALSDKYHTPIIASHSCSASLCNSNRNISDENARHIANNGGVIGVNFVGSHLTGDYFANGADVEDVICHIEHMINTCGEDAVCIGADFDGTDKLPNGIDGIQDIEKIYMQMRNHGINEILTDKIMYANAYEFFKNNLPQGE